MQRILVVALLLLFFSCEKNETNDLLPNVVVNVPVNLNLPQYYKLQIPGNYTYISNGGVNGIWLIARKTNSFKAFDASCPEYNCKEKMEFDGVFKLKCKCHNVEYSVYDGSPQDKKHTRFAREYQVRRVDKFNLLITNF
ncbi:MAG: hypothetical protein KGV44_07875 [Flavobacteriaceae bacterium]|nr:hypothetical protein [Flavobacteriaceae bacterium]